MSDLISRRDAIDALFKWYDTPAEDECHKDAIDVICKLPSAQQWIPCSEREPEEYGEYFITWVCDESTKCFIGISEYEITGVYDHEDNKFIGTWLFDDYMKYYTNIKVLAWMPLPSPWEEKS